MPTYDYVCEDCGHEFEQFQMMSAKPLRDCPECGERSLRRLIGAGAGLLFKGSGFYETDYRSSGYKKAAEAEKKGSDNSSSNGSGKSGDGGKKDAGTSSKKDGAKSTKAVSD
jgi:putative FmdB family regulatory protein